MQTRLLCEEQIRAFNDVLEVRLSVRIDERRHVRNINSFRASTTWHKQVGLEPQVRSIPEISSVEHNFAS